MRRHPRAPYAPHRVLGHAAVDESAMAEVSLAESLQKRWSVDFIRSLQTYTSPFDRLIQPIPEAAACKRCAGLKLKEAKGSKTRVACDGCEMTGRQPIPFSELTNG